MSAIVEDVLRTRLDLVGLGTYTSGFEAATRAIGLNTAELEANQRAQLGLGLGAGAAGLGILVATGKAALTSADEQADYNRAIANFKGSFSASEFNDLANSLSDLTGIDDGKIANTLGLLGTAGVTAQGAKDLAKPILNATEALKAMGVTSEEISRSVGKALQTGEPTSLKRVGIVLDETAFKAASATDRVKLLATALNEKGGADAAERFRGTLPGALQALQTSLKNDVEAFGAPLVGVLNAGANAAEGLARSVAHLPTEAFAVAGIGAVALGGGLLFLSGRALVAFASLARMNAENVQLTNAALKGKSAVDAEADSLRRLGSAADAAGGSSFANKVGGFVRGAGGIGLVLTAAGLVTSSVAGNNNGAQEIGDILTGAGTGATVGALAGPVGAIVGGLVGGLAAELGHVLDRQHEKDKAAEDPAVVELRKTVAQQAQIIAELRGLRGAFADKDVPGADQVSAGMDRLVP